MGAARHLGHAQVRRLSIRTRTTLTAVLAKSGTESCVRTMCSAIRTRAAFHKGLQHSLHGTYHRVQRARGDTAASRPCLEVKESWSTDWNEAGCNRSPWRERLFGKFRKPCCPRTCRLRVCDRLDVAIGCSIWQHNTIAYEALCIGCRLHMGRRSEQWQTPDRRCPSYLCSS